MKQVLRTILSVNREIQRGNGRKYGVSIFIYFLKLITDNSVPSFFSQTQLANVVKTFLNLQEIVTAVEYLRGDQGTNTPLELLKM